MKIEEKRTEKLENFRKCNDYFNFTLFSVRKITSIGTASSRFSFNSQSTKNRRTLDEDVLYFYIRIAQ